MARSTVDGVLRRHQMSRLADTDPTSGAVVRDQRERPGELVHLDVKTLGRIPTAAATAPTAGPPPSAEEASATTMSTRPSMTVPGSPSARSWTTRPPPAGLASWSRRLGASPSMGADRAGPDRQRQGLCRVGGLCRHGRWPGDPASAHARYRPQPNGKVERFTKTLLEEWA
jgi:hypothetical protein